MSATSPGHWLHRARSLSLTWAYGAVLRARHLRIRMAVLSTLGMKTRRLFAIGMVTFVAALPDSAASAEHEGKDWWLRSEIVERGGPDADRIIAILDEARGVSDQVVDALRRHDCDGARRYFSAGFRERWSGKEFCKWFRQFEAENAVAGYEYRNQHYKVKRGSVGPVEEATQFYYVKVHSYLSAGWFMSVTLIREGEEWIPEDLQIFMRSLASHEWLGPAAPPSYPEDDRHR